MNKVKKIILKTNKTMQEATTRPTFFLCWEKIVLNCFLGGGTNEWTTSSLKMELWDASCIFALNLCPDLQLHKKFHFYLRTKPKSNGTMHFKKVQQPGPSLGFHKRQFHGLAQNIVSAKFWTSGPDSQPTTWTCPIPWTCQHWFEQCPNRFVEP